MKILYIANARIPTEKAHGIQITNTCAALARTGARVELAVPWRRNAIRTDAFDFYGTERTFSIRKVPALDLFGIVPSKLSFALTSISFAFSAFVTSIFNRNCVLYGRDEFILWPLSFVSKKVFWESHTGSSNFFGRSLMKRAAGLVCITKGLSDFYQTRGVEETRLFVSPDGVDVRKFDIREDKAAIRKRLSLPDGFIATYCGSLGLYTWKGVDVFLDSFRSVETDVKYLIVGGSQKEVEGLRVKYADPRIVFIGKVEPSLVPRYLAASDVLVLPNRAGDEVSERFTSPMKLFEYMAAKRPIIASDLSSIREVLDGSNSLLFKPNDPESLARCVERLASDSALASRLASEASQDVLAYSWDKRAVGLIRFISSRIS